MATDAQICANQQNSQHSTGPKTECGKAASSLNNVRHGLTRARFVVLDSEDQDEFDHVLCGMRFEFQPETMNEAILVEKMAQSYWLSKRAVNLQDSCLAGGEISFDEQQKQLSLYLRYQTTHDRAYRSALSDLLKLRAERRKQEIGFESQKQKEAAESRRQSTENRKQDRHKLDMLLAAAKLNHQELLNSELQFELTGSPLIPERLRKAEKAA